MLLARVGLFVALGLLIGSERKCAERNPPNPTPGTQPSPPKEPSPAPLPTPAAKIDPKPDAFVTTVRPILTSHCAPCHEPGGVMYERLPFDRGEVVASHSAGVLKRLKVAEERESVEKWLKSMDTAAAEP